MKKQPKKNVLAGVEFTWLKLSKAERGALVLATLFMGLAAWMNARIPVTIGNMASNLTSSQSSATPWSITNAIPFLIVLGLLFLGREILQVMRKYIVHRVATTVEMNVNIQLISHLLQLDISEFENERVGTLQSRIRRSVEGFVKMLKLAFMDFFPAILTALFAAIIAWQQNHLLGAIIASSLIPSLLIVHFQINTQRGIRIDLRRKKEIMDGTVVEQLNGIEYVRAADTHGAEVRRVRQVSNDLRLQEMRHHIAMGWFDFAKTVVEAGFFVAVTATAIWLASKGSIPVGDIITSSMLFASVLTPFREIHRILDEASESLTSVSDLQEMFDNPRDQSFDVQIPQKIQNTEPQFTAIELKGISIQYRKNNGGRTALSNVTTSIKRGQLVGIVGATASGKSTLIKTVLRLLHPTEGTLLIDGVSIEKLDRNYLRQTVGYAGQIPFLFAGTVKANLMYGCNSVDDQKLEKAIDMAALTNDLRQIEGHLLGEVAELGKNLAGGLKQRMALARLFIQDQPIFVLDEPTSALDSITESKILESLEAMKGNKTILMVAHRLNTLKNADRILVFERGRLVEDGSFEELVSKNGIFAELARRAESGILGD